MSGDVSIDIILAVERAFDGGDMRRVAHPRLWQQSQKRLPSVSTYAARGGGARRTPQFLQTVPLRAFSSAVERARSGFSHTPQEPQTHIGAAPPRAGVKRAPGRRDRGAQKAAHSNPKTIEFSKAACKNARRAPSRIQNRSKRERARLRLAQKNATRSSDPRAGILSAK